LDSTVLRLYSRLMWSTNAAFKKARAGPGPCPLSWVLDVFI
jgi:hypothetical protein